MSDDANTGWEKANNIGNVLVRRGALTAQQLQAAVDAQEAARNIGNPSKLGELCVLLNLCTQADVDTALEEQRAMLAPASNAEAAQNALNQLDRVVRKASKTSTKLKAVTDVIEKRTAPSR